MKPPALKPGDCIGIMAPSSYVEKDDIEQSSTLLEQRGFKTFIHPQTYERHHQLAGTDEQKVSALEELWSRDDIHAIWVAGGGNRALNLLEQIDYDLIKDNPKALIGFSDTTALLNSIHKHTGLVTFHGPVFKNLYKMSEEQLSYALGLLSGEIDELPLENVTVLQNGHAEGILVGGCLSIFQYLAGTDDCPPLEGSILFLEDVSEHLSRIDRMLHHLKRIGVFEKITGLVLGEFIDMQEGKRPFGLSLDEIIIEYLGGRDIPVITNAPFGHGDNLYTLPVGLKVSVNIDPLAIKCLK